MLASLFTALLILPFALCNTRPTLNLVLPATNVLPNPSILPPSTHALLSSSSSHLTAPLSSSNSFSFRNLSSGSYTLDITCLTYTFPFYRVDVSESGAIEVWQMFRTQGWDARGPRVGGGEGEIISVSIGVLGPKEFYEVRAGFSPMSLLKNPMILMACVSFGLVVGMPYLIDNMDPEMRAEFEQQKGKNPLASGAASSALQNFDMAAWMAGKTAPNPSSAEGSGGSTGRDTGEGRKRR